MGRNPSATATTTTSPVVIMLRMTLSITCPVSIAERAMDMVRNRSTMPSATSVEMLTAVVEAPNPAQSRMIPGTT
ncbi:Uncharacterised protein [Mycobacteroides abscessus subsp. abscessus]|nr:Uncharacterised protein [Mycobacteroides abscessus subsp. abscessus]